MANGSSSSTPGPSSPLGDHQRLLGGRREQRPAHVGEATRHPLHEVGQRGDGLDDALALGHEVLLEVVDVGLQEVAPGEQGLDLALDLHPLGLAGAPGLARASSTRRSASWRAASRPDAASSRAAASTRSASAWASATVRVGGALGEQQRAADRLGLVDGVPHLRLGSGLGALGGLLGQLLEAGDGGPGPGLHRRGLVLGGLQRRRDLLDEGVDLGLVVAPLGGLEAGVRGCVVGSVPSAQLS